MMHMTLYWGTEVTLPFDSWKTESWASYSLSLLALLAVATFFQYLENCRVRLRLFAGAGVSTPPTTEVPAARAPLLEWKFSKDKAKLGVKFAGAVLFGLNSGIGYLLMVAIMSFNGGVFVAIVLGLTIGYFFFRSEIVENDDNGADAVVESSCACA